MKNLIDSYWNITMLYRIIKCIEKKIEGVYARQIKKQLSQCGNRVYIGKLLQFCGGKYIKVGDNVSVGTDSILTAFDSYKGLSFIPEIIIGDGTIINSNAHITAINSIRIGENVLFGKYVTVTDNSHGHNDSLEELNTAPLIRPVYSKGPVVIENNVWIGDKAIILPGVTIGKGSIIGAGAVVTKDIQPYSIAVGNPARVIRTITK